MGVVTGEVIDAALDVQTSSIDITSIGSRGRQWIPGPTDIRFTAELAEGMNWDKTVIGVTGDPPDMLALLALARRHPKEYQELHEGENILKALGG
jgi:hypothetical protein